jgi:hypothetical protein
LLAAVVVGVGPVAVVVPLVTVMLLEGVDAAVEVVSLLHPLKTKAIIRMIASGIMIFFTFNSFVVFRI